jgi:hypothetical protein
MCPVAASSWPIVVAFGDGALVHGSLARPGVWGHRSLISRLIMCCFTTVVYVGGERQPSFGRGGAIHDYNIAAGSVEASTTSVRTFFCSVAAVQRALFVASRTITDLLRHNKIWLPVVHAGMEQVSVWFALDAATERKRTNGRRG